MRIQLNQRRSDDGAIAVVVGILSVALLGFAALSVDIGMAMAQRQAVGTGADSAALAIVREQQRAAIDDPRSCTTLLADADVQSDAEATALAQVNANSPFGLTIPADAVTTNLACVGAGDEVLEARVMVSHSSQTYLGNLAGVAEIDFDREAVANLGVANEVGGVLPLALCVHQAQEIMDHAEIDRAAGLPYRAETIRVDRVWTAPNLCRSSTGASGNWGWLDLGQGNGASALGELIRTGHGATIDLTGPTYSLNGTPGSKENSGPVKTGMEMRMDQRVTMPVYDRYDEDLSGQNAMYNIIGFISVQLCGYDNGSKRGTCFDSTIPGYPNDLQVRYVDFSPAGSIGDICGLADPCAFNAYVTALTE